MKLALYTQKIIAALIFALFFTIAAQAAIPACVSQVSPASGASVVKSATNDYTFSWTAGDVNTVGYQFRISTNADGSSPFYTSGILDVSETSKSFTISLNCNITYYWATIPFGFNNPPPTFEYATGCTYVPLNIVPAPAPTEYPTANWSVTAYSDPAFTTYAGYYTQDNTGTSGLSLYFNSTTAWTSFSNPSSAIANSGTNVGTPPGTGSYAVTSFNGCAFAGSANYSYTYKRTSTLTAGNYTFSFRQIAATGNAFAFKVNGTTYLASAATNSSVTLFLPANAQLEVSATHGASGTSSLELRTVAVATPTALDPGTLVADSEVCYNTNPGAGYSATPANAGGCSGLAYQWQSAPSAGGPWTDISGATAANVNLPALTTTAYYKRIVTDYCNRTAETAVMSITVAPNNYSAGTIAYSDLALDTICTGSTPAAFTSVTPASGGPSFVTYTYQWVSGANANGTTVIPGETNATYTPSAGIAATTFYRRRMNVVGCATAPTAIYSNAIAVVVQAAAPAAPASITGPLAICVNETGMSYTSAAISGASSYTWTVPTGVTITSGQGTRFLTVSTDGTYAGGTLSVVAVNSCGAGALRSVTLTLATSCTSTWNGNTSTNWATASNWTPTGVPVASTDVVIPSGRPNMPTISSGKREVKSLTIDAGTTLTVSAGTLSVNNDLTVNGTLTQSGGTIRFVGGATQTFTSVANPQVFKTLTLNGAGVSIASPVSLEGTVTLTSGTLTTNNNVTLRPDNGGVVAFVNGNTGTVSGQVTVIKAIASNYRYISSPLVDVQASELSDDMTLVSGSLSRISTFDYSIPGFKSRTDVSAVELGSGGAGKLFVPAAGGGITADFTGTINNTGSFTSSVISNATANRDLFVGNPYPSSLNIDATAGWTFTGVSNTFYFWNSSTNSFSTYQRGAPGVGANGGTNIIPMFQAYFLKTTGTGPASASVTMGPRIRVTTAQSLYRTTLSDENLSFKVTSSATSVSDETIVRLSDIGSIEFDTLDSYKFRNPSTSINVFTKSEDIEYVINTVPTSAETVVPLNLIVPANGTYSITVPTSATSEVVLKDKLLNIEKVADGTDYVFTATTADNEARFEVLFRTSLTTGTKSASAASNVNIASTGKNIVVIAKNSLSNSTLRVYNAVGVLVLEVPNTSISAGTNVLEDISLESGAYIIKISNDGNEYIGHTNIVK